MALDGHVLFAFATSVNAEPFCSCDMSCAGGNAGQGLSEAPLAKAAGMPDAPATGSAAATHTSQRFSVPMLCACRQLP